ncbi:hypothetical protein M8818_000333 [Zalaria obscura]|uniref:Uncharacterized protein n=1 Tax=Zalaria obscura TaxID=2024903 RepID=A0ACC3SR82_9PEZI
MESSPLSKLPAELRNHIYELVLTKVVTDDRPSFVEIERLVACQQRFSTTGSKPDPGAGILSSNSLFATCHQMKAECLPIYFTVNRFRDDVSPLQGQAHTFVPAWLASLELEHLHALRDVTVAHELNPNRELIRGNAITSILLQLINLTQTLPLRPKCLRLQLICFASGCYSLVRQPGIDFHEYVFRHGRQQVPERIEQPTVIIGDVLASEASLESACSAETIRFTKFQNRRDLSKSIVPQDIEALKLAGYWRSLNNYLQLTRARHGRLVETMVAEMGLSTATSTQLDRV